MKRSPLRPRSGEIVLPASIADRLAAGHPWVYRDHVPAEFRAPSGTWVTLRSGNWVGRALWDADSPIALRVFSRSEQERPGWLLERVRLAWELRQPLREQGVTGFRWLFGEGDGVPGVVVDYYAGYCVIMTYADCLDALVPPLVTALREVCAPTGIVRRRAAGEVQLLHGQAPPRDLTVAEHDGVLLSVDVVAGQKTGLFLDHRENRRSLGQLARGRSVLNLFSYTGGFSVAAAKGGARSVISVDIAGPASAAAVRNFELNGLANFPHQAVTADVFEFLDQAANAGRRFDVVVCDPPSFAKNRTQLKAAEKAYRKLTTLGFKVTEPGGLYAAASCTSQVSPEAFRAILAEASRKARVRFQILHDIGQPLDHPVLAAHPEGRYLKFVVGRVLPQD